MALAPSSPEAEAKLRVKARTEYRFLDQNDYLPDDGDVTRTEVESIVESLDRWERRVLQKRIQTNLDRLRHLMAADRRTYDEPYVTCDDLVAGVTVPECERQ